MSDSPTVKFDSVWKRLTRRAQVTTLAELLYAVPRRLLNPRQDGLREHEFWALQNLNFELKPGESLGVIGPNGAGKSSLLKLLFRIFRPDRGHIETRGRVTGLIELGAGFHPILNGRENVFINGAILGMRQKEIRAKYDAIVEFAELGEFMDMPVKNYSSGMAARLSFAIAAHADPDVLLVDEVLAVGDASFQVRCYEWIERTRKAGTTIVMVSHQMHVLQNADRVLYLDTGEPRVLDEPGVAIARYLADQAELIRESDAKHAAAKGITRVQLLQGDEPAHEVPAGAPATFRVHYEFEQPVSDPVVTLELVHNDPRFLISTPGAQLAQLSSGASLRGQTAQGSGCFDVEVGALQLPVGMYSVRAAVKAQGDFTASIRRDDVLRFEIMRPAESDATSLIDLPQSWRIVEPSEIPQP
mgnify:FL=1